jgi:hypothetical protein
MIHDVDASLAALIRAEALAAEAEVVFDAPTTSWAARRAGPVINVFLYDLREDVARRDANTDVQRDRTGRVTGRQRGLRWYRLSYLVTAWTNRPDDEHRLLGQLLETLLCYDRIPAAHLAGRLREQTVSLSVSLPPGQDRSVSDLWSALGGEMKPSLDVVLGVPVLPAQTYPVGPPVLEPPQVHVQGVAGRGEATAGGGLLGAALAPDS